MHAFSVACVHISIHAAPAGHAPRLLELVLQLGALLDSLARAWLACGWPRRTLSRLAGGRAHKAMIAPLMRLKHRLVSSGKRPALHGI